VTRTFSCITRSLSLFVGRNIISNIYFFVSIENVKSQKQKKKKPILLSIVLSHQYLWSIPAIHQTTTNNNLDKRKKKRNNNFRFSVFCPPQSFLFVYLCTVYMTLGKNQWEMKSTESESLLKLSISERNGSASPTCTYTRISKHSHPLTIVLEGE
jgi:hypothetical protein